MERSPQSALEVPGEFRHIKGWGIDADPRNDPTYPMKQRSNREHAGYTWTRPPQQLLRAGSEVHHSIERPNLSAVFGTAPGLPGVLSGLLRNLAFRKSENAYGHWLPLLLADRVNVVEGLLDDLRRGRLPNILEEKGMRAEWRYNREHLLAKLALTAGVAYLAYRHLSRHHD